MANNRCVELDIMKFWGILLVVLGHVTNMYTPAGLIQPIIPSTTLCYISSLVYSFHMPLFVFVSGAVYCYQCEKMAKKNTIMDLIKKKAKRLLIPYLVFGIIMIVLMVGLDFRGDYLNYAYHGIFLSQDCRHLWFVLMLFETFVLFWFVKKGIDLLNLPNWCLLLVSFVFYLFANKFPYLLQISSTFQYQFWFVSGYVFLLYRSVFQKISVNYTLGGVILLLGVIRKQHIPFEIPLWSTIVAMTGIMLFYQISSDFQKISRSRLFKITNRDSYGIYLYHVIFVYLLFYFTKDKPINPYLLSLIVFMVSLFMSVAATELTRKMGLQIIIGEKKKL